MGLLSRFAEKKIIEMSSDMASKYKDEHQFDTSKNYVLINASNGEAVGVFENSISARLALDAYLKSSFSSETSIKVDIFLYRMRIGGGSVYPVKWTFTRDNHAMLMSKIMI